MAKITNNTFYGLDEFLINGKSTVTAECIKTS